MGSSEGDSASWLGLSMGDDGRGFSGYNPGGPMMASELPYDDSAWKILYE